MSKQILPFIIGGYLAYKALGGLATSVQKVKETVSEAQDKLAEYLSSWIPIEQYKAKLVPYTPKFKVWAESDVIKAMGLEKEPLFNIPIPNKIMTIAEPVPNMKRLTQDLILTSGESILTEQPKQGMSVAGVANLIKPALKKSLPKKDAIALLTRLAFS